MFFIMLSDGGLRNGRFHNTAHILYQLYGCQSQKGELEHTRVFILPVRWYHPWLSIFLKQAAFINPNFYGE